MWEWKIVRLEYEEYAGEESEVPRGQHECVWVPVQRGTPFSIKPPDTSGHHIAKSIVSVLSVIPAQINKQLNEI